MSDPHLLMCAPTHYSVQYVINPWMDGNIGRVHHDAAQEQWESLRELLARTASLDIVEPAPNFPDMAFVANAGLVYGNVYVPARFRFAEREGETPIMTRWFEDRDFRIVDLADIGTFEGEGDALFQPGEALVWGGYGVRTSLQVYREIASALNIEIVPLRLVDERFYHLDTCFCPLEGGRLIYFPEAFDQASLRAIRRRVPAEKRFEVPTTDALNFACNAVVVGKNFTANYAGPELAQKLTSWGYSVQTTPLSEFMLAGGAAKCLVLTLSNSEVDGGNAKIGSGVCDRIVDLQGQLLDTGLMNEVLDCVTEGGGSFEIESFQAGLRRDQDSRVSIRVVAPSAQRLETLLGRLLQLGARVATEERDADLVRVLEDGVAPEDFYSTTIYPTDVRIGGEWVKVALQRMDALLVVNGDEVECTLLRDLKRGDEIVCGVEGIRIHTGELKRNTDEFEFMASSSSSERRVELTVENIAWEMQQIRRRGGKIVVVPGPVVVHTGGAPYLAHLVRQGYVQALLGGNAVAVHDIELACFGTSLGLDLSRGRTVHGGHRHHLQAINMVRRHGSIEQAVKAGDLDSGIFFECVQKQVPFALAGSIRDDGPLPETQMDLIKAQEEYAQLIQGADMILMLASMLHSIGVGNMTPAGVRLICVDISPAVVTKLSDRGSMESTGVVTDVGLFLNLLAAELTE